MKKKILLNLVVLLVTSALAPAATRYVPSEYPTIQAAIDAASENDEIIVSIGTYYENIDFGGKNVILRSTDPTNPSVVGSTIIDGGHAGSVVTFSGMESPTCVLSGFTITNGSGTGGALPRGGGIYGNATLATIQYNIILGNYAFPPMFPGSGYGGGLYDCDGTIQCNIISGNGASCDEGGAAGGGLCNCDGIIQNNVISDNLASGFGSSAGGGLYDCNGTIQNNTIFGNSAGSGAGGGFSDCKGLIINCIIWQNTAGQGAQLHTSSTPSYSCIQDWIGGGTGNISDNPQLVDPAGSDFHLQSESPCKDIGVFILGLTEDFEGDSRPQGYGYDIGADEFISDNVPPDTPTNISPANGATDVSLTPTLTASAFSDPDFGDTHQASQWHIWVCGSNPDYSRTVFALTKESGDLLSIITPSRTLSDNITYTWSVRYQDNQGAWSGWSDATEFTTEETGEVITIPGDCLTIQDAIDSAIYGDEIVVSIGTYYENIDFGGKNVILRSTDPTNPSVVGSTIIDGGHAGSVVTFSGDEPPTCILSGFTITNGNESGICGNSTLATVQNNIITGNSGGKGGGITFCHGTIRNNTVSGNSAEGAYASQGGGLYCCHGTIEHNLITNNQASAEGGGLTNCDGTIQYNTISNNSGGGSGAGGLLGCGGTIQYNIISGNSGRHGGGFYQCHGTIQNNLILGNSAQGWGGGLYYCYATIRNNTICGNSGSYGGGVSRGGTIQNCILWGNTATTSGPQTYLAGSITYSCVEDSGGSTNIGIDPCFVDPNNSDYHLLEDSPCIDAGDPCYIAEPDETDLDGNPRVIGGRIDMGAYEFDPLDLLIDLSESIDAMGLPKGIANSLLAKLDTALQKLEDDNENNDAAAVNLLEAFINTVEAQSGKKIPKANADTLIEAAQEIIELLSK